MIMKKGLKLYPKLLISYILIGLVPLILMGLFSVIYAQKTLFNQTRTNLISICDAKSISIKNFLSSHLSNVKTLSRSVAIVDAVETLQEAFDEMGGTHVNNPLWQALFNRYYPGFEYYVDEQGYQDLYLISPDGDIVFSVAQKEDLGQNLFMDQYKNSSLAQCFKKAMEREYLSDFSLYAPHDNAPAAFVGAAITRNDKISGVVALYISIDMINQIMLRRSGLGESGETYLVGEDYLVRSDAYHSKDFSVQNSFENPGERMIKNQATQQSFMGMTGCLTGENYLGIPVITAFTPVVISEMTWTVIADINKEEAFEPIRVFKFIIGGAIITGILIIIFVSFLISGRISNPIKQLTEATEKISDGQFDVRIDRTLIRSGDEVGFLAASFDNMALKLDRTMKDLVNEIQEKEQAHEALRDNEERLQAILNNTTSIVFLKDLQGRFILVNRQFEKIFNRPAADILGKTEYDIFQTQHAGQSEQNDQKVLEVNGPMEFEETAKLFDGLHTYLSVKFPIYNKEGNPYAICGIATDITELKKKEQVIADALAFNEKIIYESPIGMAIYDSTGQCLEINKAMCAAIGTNRETALAQNYHQIKSWKQTGLYDLARQAIREGTTRNGKFFIKTTFGKEIWLEVFLLPFMVEGYTHLLVMGMDITQRVQAEKEKEKMEGQLRQAHKMEAIGTLAGGIAHDFNNILSAILGYSEMIRKEVDLKSPTRVKIDKVIKAGNRAKELIMQILSFSRKSDHEEKHSIQAQIVVEEVIKLLRATIPTTIDIRLKIDPGCGYIMGNSIQIHQVMINLCGNAAQAMENTGGVMTVSLTPVTLDKGDLLRMPDIHPGKYIRLSVQDMGIGIPKDIIDRIFDPYFTTKEVGKGSGMGLAVVHGIVKAHEGGLMVTSTPGAGTTFDVYFPQTQIRDIEPETEIPVPQSGREHILVVDDEESLVEINKLRLESLGYTVTGLTSSANALEIFRSDPDGIDLVVTDHTMPGMTGKQLAAEISAIKPGIPVILCSGYAHHVDEPVSDATGIAAFALKPIDVDDLAGMIRKILDENPV